jgi:hypothetical protein
MAPRIVGGSNYQNPYANVASLDPFAANSFAPFDDSEPATPGRTSDTANDPFNGFQALKSEEIPNDWVGEIKSEFQEAQRRNSQARPRGRSKDALISDMQKDATNFATGG